MINPKKDKPFYRNCPKCGTTMDGLRQCPSCGYKLRGRKPKPKQMVTPSTPQPQIRKQYNLSQQMINAIENAVQGKIQDVTVAKGAATLEQPFWIKTSLGRKWLVYPITYVDPNGGELFKVIYCIPEGGILNSTCTQFAKVETS